MKKTIPEVVTYFCDICQKELKGTDKKGNYKVVMSSDGLDFAGHAVGRGAGGEFECCYNCYTETLTKLRPKKVELPK